MPSRARSLLAASLFLLAGSPAAAQLVNRFDTTPESWSIVSYPFRSHVSNPTTAVAPFDAAFGNPAGSLRVGDVYTETGLSAPPSHLGNKSGYYGGSLTYDILIRFSDAVVYPAVVLNGGTFSLYYDAPAPQLNTWTTLTVPLTEVGWRVSGGSTPATETQMRAVLANLQGIYLYTEWHTGPDDTSVDNVVLAGPVPVPSVGGLGGSVLATLLVLASRRRLQA